MLQAAAGGLEIAAGGQQQSPGHSSRALKPICNPIQPAAPGLGGLAVGENFQELKAADQGQAPGRQGTLSA